MPELFPTFKKISPTNINNRWLRYAIYIAVATVIFTFILNNFIQPRSDRILFSELEKSLDSTVGSLSINRSTKSKNCRRSQEKLGPGRLICEIKIVFESEENEVKKREVKSEINKRFNVARGTTLQGFNRDYFYFKEIQCYFDYSRIKYQIYCSNPSAGYIF